MNEVPQYLDERKVSERTGLSVATLRMHRHKCKGIPYHKVGRRVLYDPADVQVFMQGCRIVPGKAA